MEDLFLKISRREIPSACVYEDERFFAFLDIQPCNKGHVLVIPKMHFRNIFDMDAESFSALARVVHTIALATKEATGADGINIVMNNEVAAGQEIFHAHVHIIPRFVDDKVFAPPRHTTYAEGEMETVAEEIRSALL